MLNKVSAACKYSVQLMESFVYSTCIQAVAISLRSKYSSPFRRRQLVLGPRTLTSCQDSCQVHSLNWGLSPYHREHFHVSPLLASSPRFSVRPPSGQVLPSSLRQWMKRVSLVVGESDDWTYPDRKRHSEQIRQRANNWKYFYTVKFAAPNPTPDHHTIQTSGQL
jgi:hypothetical protein